MAAEARNLRCCRLQHAITDFSTFSYRLHMDYYLHGSLWDVLDDDKYHKEHLVPEPAVWTVFFEDPTHACFLLGTGAAPMSPPVDGWRMIVHCDINHGNIFLSIPEQ